MGKKRIKFIEEESVKSGKTAKVKSGKAEEARLSDMGQKALEELEKIKEKEKQLEKEILKKSKEKVKEEKLKKPLPVKVRSQRYQSIKKNIDVNKKYPLGEAVELVIKNSTASFDESVEVHLVSVDKLSGSVRLPHGTGKKQRVAIANEELIEQIQKGKLDFDILVASPMIMSKLAKVAKILGPKGLMPNPKTGTISDKPEELKKRFESGAARFKTEPKANLLHFTIGKVSFGKDKLLDNLKAFLAAVRRPNIIKATLCSTMGPGIKLDLEKI